MLSGFCKKTYFSLFNNESPFLNRTLCVIHRFCVLPCFLVPCSPCFSWDHASTAPMTITMRDRSISGLAWGWEPSSQSWFRGAGTNPSYGRSFTAYWVGSMSSTPSLSQKDNTLVFHLPPGRRGRVPISILFRNRHCFQCRHIARSWE